MWQLNLTEDHRDGARPTGRSVPTTAATRPVGGTARSLPEPMRVCSDRVRGHAHGNWISSAEVEKVQRAGRSDREANVGIQVGGTQDQRPGVAVADNRIEKRHLKRLADVVDSKSRALSWVGEPAGTEVKGQGIGEAIEGDVVPDAVCRRLSQRQRRRREWMRRAGHRSGKGTCCGVLRCAPTMASIRPPRPRAASPGWTPSRDGGPVSS
ncbi:MAG: hypothetical protein JWL84_3318 [Rhodospirillales bacterium]|nr:hypothetical protein [Rhodospirillales bacterium]